MISKLLFLKNDQTHKGYAITLGQLMGAVEVGATTHNSDNANYEGIELNAQLKAQNYPTLFGYCLKKDCSGDGATLYGRSKRRILVNLDTNHALVENWAMLWDHGENFKLLAKEFFTAAQPWREATKSLILTKQKNDLLAARR